MQATDKKSWLDQLEITGPIKGIMAFVDELANTYDKRVAAMHADYQKDVEEILECYRHEKHSFNELFAEQKQVIINLQTEIKTLQHNYKALDLEYKFSQDCLETSKAELTALTKALKSEQELVALANQRIRAAQQQIDSTPMPSLARLPEYEYPAYQKPQTEMTEQADAVPDELQPAAIKKPRFTQVRVFFKQVIARKRNKPIILHSVPHKTDPMITEDLSTDPDTFSY